MSQQLSSSHLHDLHLRRIPAGLNSKHLGMIDIINWQFVNFQRSHTQKPSANRRRGRVLPKFTFCMIRHNCMKRRWVVEEGGGGGQGMSRDEHQSSSELNDLQAYLFCMLNVKTIWLKNQEFPRLRLYYPLDITWQPLVIFQYRPRCESSIVDLLNVSLKMTKYLHKQ